MIGETGAGDRQLESHLGLPGPGWEWAAGYKPHPEISPLLNLAFGKRVEIVIQQIYNGLSDSGNFYRKQAGRSI